VPVELLASWNALEDIQPGSGELVYYPKSHLFPEFLFDDKYKWLVQISERMVRSEDASDYRIRS